MAHDNVTFPVDREALIYREGVGIMVLNAKNEVFIARRVDFPDGDWQMPQGGIDSSETPEQAAIRELREETGMVDVEIINEAAGWRYYELPDHLVSKLWDGKFRGQKQKWFLARFTGDDSQINLTTHVQEFCDWRWAPLQDVPSLAVYFKRESYNDIIDEFSRFI